MTRSIRRSFVDVDVVVVVAVVAVVAVVVTADVVVFAADVVVVAVAAVVLVCWSTKTLLPSQLIICRVSSLAR